jgi:hypothetical protein
MTQKWLFTNDDDDDVKDYFYTVTDMSELRKKQASKEIKQKRER